MRSAYLPRLDPDDDQPLFLALARAIERDIRAGRLRPGERLPGSRTLAERAGLNRNTVLAALAELESQGWLRSEAARGCFVDVALPEPARVKHRGGGQPAYDLPPMAPPPGIEPPPPGALAMLGGRPDLRLLPLRELARAYRRALRASGRRLVDYGDPRGLPVLRAALMGWLGERRGLAGDEDDLLVTRGSQQALYLAAQALLRPGDRVAVEALGYRPAWAALRAAGAELVPIPVDAEGLDVAALEAAHQAAPLKMVYVTPHHQYPTGAVLSPERRAGLLALAATARFAILEDDYDHEFHYRGRPVLPLASADAAGVVIYVGTLSKAFAPGLRLGFVHAPRVVLERLAGLRLVVDRQGDAVVEAAVAELLADGVLQRHVRKASLVYQSRRDLLCELLQRHLPGLVSAEPPIGGMAVWARTALEPVAWAEAALGQGVVFQPGPMFAFHPMNVPYARLGYAGLDEAELVEATRRLTLAARALTGGAGRMKG